VFGIERTWNLPKRAHSFFARRIYQKGQIVSLRHLRETRKYITQSLKMQQVKLGKKNVYTSML
jgi:hypothetical protein